MNSNLVNGIAVIGGYVLADWALSSYFTPNNDNVEPPKKKEDIKESEGQYGIPEKEINGVMTRSITVDNVRYWRSVSSGVVFDESGRLVGATWSPSLRPSNAPGGDLILFVDGRVSVVGGRTIGTLLVRPGMPSTFQPAVAVNRSTVKTPPGGVALSGASASGVIARNDSLYESDLS